MSSPKQLETFRLSLQTTVGELQAEISVPTSFIPISDIVPLMRSLGEQALAMEEDHNRLAGHQISCHKGCAACCRMLVPVSPPEAFALQRNIEQLPVPLREKILTRLSSVKKTLEQSGLLGKLVQISETRSQLSDEDMEPVNQAYYAQRLPCVFLEDEVCSIYEFRPAACRELLVTSPKELCQDIAQNPVVPLSAPFRIATVLSLMWAELTKGPAKLIPLPVALDWADRHAKENQSTQTGESLLKMGLDKILGFLRQNS
ncbi:YkgJ family cysteine cluster protein [Candidatus Nitronereus thalassa]|uniref:YkgJ family cysteine cluster protein n=1 Tax=Candidatus Nitronereus thalassa TaxID=3020898 RepID=A0ABU3KC23_9BACT|nr:YkgJ family cysteine cluster protein [Candidatus Nitronereus thalassa]MDT7043938.1 YkgJ family cysteine cluster protein [Candidatus Nitronereus thalassa]